MHTLIIGGGLSGLALAEALEREGRDYLLVEARDRVGGRILSAQVGGASFDLGPAWFWSGQQRIAALITRLGLQKFDQYARGELTFEDAQGRVQRGRGFASMEGSWRLKGGLSALTDALQDRLPPERVRLNAQVTELAQTPDGITARFANGEVVRADRVVLALPPRVAAQIKYTPALPIVAKTVMGDVPTWMAGQAKAVAVYETAFWRTAGLSGAATSRFGPMIEIHDASPAQDGPSALFGFIGVPPQGRADVPALRQHILAQLVRLFGPEAGRPIKLLVQDWAYDPLTATEVDRVPLYAHPDYGMPAALQELWDGRLIMAGTEVAQQFGGYLEGALEAAEAAFRT
ncbi:flavin monoamine oxidase family protein [Sulfitobacter sp.]|uniref:flavin monoamine oxidase family protein n=1 Tax=Sulfitobacter sp. TaxID=1903071 RepID=UPI003002017F